MKISKNLLYIIVSLLLFLLVVSCVNSCESSKIYFKTIQEKEQAIKERENKIKEEQGKVKEAENRIAELEETVKKREKELEEAKKKHIQLKEEIKKYTPSDYEVFYENRYSAKNEDVKSTDTELTLTFNIVEKVTEELVDKDFLSFENIKLKENITTKDVIIYEKDSIIKIKDVIIEEKDKNFSDVNDINKSLEDVIKKEKKKGVWNVIKATGLGILVGIAGAQLL